jgi:hypothetical protein
VEEVAAVPLEAEAVVVVVADGDVQLEVK